MTEGAYVPIEKVANHLCVTVHTIRSWVRQGNIPRNTYVKVGNTYRFSLQEVIAALTTNDGNMEDPVPETPGTEQDNQPVQLELNFDVDQDA